MFDAVPGVERFTAKEDCRLVSAAPCTRGIPLCTSSCWLDAPMGSESI